MEMESGKTSMLFLIDYTSIPVKSNVLTMDRAINRKQKQPSLIMT